jgi:hypothetical protein
MATSQAPKGADELAAENAAVGGGVTSRELIERAKANAIEKQAAKAGILPAEAQALIQQRRLQREIAVAIASETWGKDLSHDMCMAVASYCQQNKLDHSEIDILGGNLYRNAKYYKRRLAEAVEDGLVAYYRSDFIQKDARLEDAAAAGNEWASAESARRFQERAMRGAPDAATGCCIARIKMVGVEGEFAAVKWCGGGTQKKRGKGGVVYDGDPVGDLFPIESSETRAIRRVMQLVISSIPHLRWQEDELSEVGASLSKVIKESVERNAGQIAAHDIQAHPKPIKVSPEGNVYALAPLVVPNDAAQFVGDRIAVVEKLVEMARVPEAHSAPVEGRVLTDEELEARRQDALDQSDDQFPVPF